MNKQQITALVIRFVIIGVISVIILPMFARITSGQALVIALALTLITFFAGDIGILPRFGNVTATVANVIIAALVIGIADWGINGIITLDVTGWILALVLIAVGEWFFHRYLKTVPVPGGDAPKEE